ncbi:MAG: PEGA domain-containing protein [Myxococcales bacterium]
MEQQHPYIDFADLVGANLSLAVAYFRLGLDSDGEKALGNVVRLDPERKLDAEKYPPVFIRAFDNVNKRIKKAPRAAIEVKPTSGGASVILDGREVGHAPVLIKDVIKGPHFLRVGDGWSNRVEVPGSDTVKVAPDLGAAGGPVPELIGLLARNVIDDLVISRAVALAEQAPADFVVLGGVHKEGDAVVVSSHLLKVASKKTCLLQRVVFDLEMLGAGIEIYKVGADITNKLDVFGDEEKLPAKVARDALPPAGRTATTTIASVSASGGEHVTVASTDPAPGNERVVRKTDEPKPKPADAPTVASTTEVRKVTATSGEPEMIPLEPTGPGEEPAKRKKDSGGLGTTGIVLIVLAVVAVAAGGGVGGYFIVDSANKPITGRGTIQW